MRSGPRRHRSPHHLLESLCRLAPWRWTSTTVCPQVAGLTTCAQSSRSRLTTLHELVPCVVARTLTDGTACIMYDESVRAEISTWPRRHIELASPLLSSIMSQIHPQPNPGPPPSITDLVAALTRQAQQQCECQQCADARAYPSFNPRPDQHLQQGILGALLQLYGQTPADIAPPTATTAQELCRKSSAISTAASDVSEKLPTSVRPELRQRRRSWYHAHTDGDNTGGQDGRLSIRQKRRQSITVQVSSPS